MKRAGIQPGRRAWGPMPTRSTSSKHDTAPAYPKRPAANQVTEEYWQQMRAEGLGRLKEADPELVAELLDTGVHEIDWSNGSARPPKKREPPQSSWRCRAGAGRRKAITHFVGRFLGLGDYFFTRKAACGLSRPCLFGACWPTLLRLVRGGFAECGRLSACSQESGKLSGPNAAGFCAGGG